MNRHLLIAAAAISLGACSGSDAPGPSAPPAEEPQETVFDPMVGTMDRAREVEGLNMSRKDAMDEEIEKADGSADWE